MNRSGAVTNSRWSFLGKKLQARNKFLIFRQHSSTYRPISDLHRVLLCTRGLIISGNWPCMKQWIASIMPRRSGADSLPPYAYGWKWAAKIKNLFRMIFGLSSANSWQRALMNLGCCIFKTFIFFDESKKYKSLKINNLQDSFGPAPSDSFESRIQNYVP